MRSGWNRAKLGGVLGICLAAAVVSRGRMPGQNIPGPPVPPGLPGSPAPADDEDMRMSREMQDRLAEKRNAERQRQLVSDTNKLLDLATELKAEVDKTNKDILSVDVIKKAAEIEKLAKSVREKMKAE